MKITRCKTLCAILSVGLVSAVTLIWSHSPAAVLAFDKKLGQDVSGKNCERKDTSESSTFGKCENVCKDKEVTRDAENNRWVCSASKAVVRRPLGERAPIGDKTLAPAATPTPKRQPSVSSQSGKARKN